MTERESLDTSSTEEIFNDWLRRQDSGDDQSLEELMEANPERAEALGKLNRDFENLGELMLRFGVTGGLSEQLTSRYGDNVDPKVELESEEASGDFTEEVMGRLSQRSSSTRYRVKGDIAEGGMGAILRVWDEDLRRHLAMKVILGRSGGSGSWDGAVHKKQLARFLEEAQITGQLDHPSIVPVHELGLDSRGRAYFTMKLVKGQTLKEVFDKVQMGEDGWSLVRALGVIQKVCEAMSYAHDKKVIHRDLKPANVMVGRYGEVYVMDWGLAKILGETDKKDIRIRPEKSKAISVIRSDRAEATNETPDSPLYTMDGDVVGTPAYMSPEQANGDLEALGPQSDVYAVGAMLYHLLAGHMPYLEGGRCASNYAIWRWVQEGPPASLSNRLDLPLELVSISAQAMSRSLEGRYADMSSLASDIQAYLEGRVVGAHESGLLAEGRKWVRRNRGISVAATCVVLVSIVGTIIGWSLAAKERSSRLELEDVQEDLKAKNVELQKMTKRAQEGERIVQEELGNMKLQYTKLEGQLGLLRNLSDQPNPSVSLTDLIPHIVPVQLPVAQSALVDALPAGDPEFTLSAFCDRFSSPTYRVGEEIVLFIETQESCYVQIWHISTKGDKKLVFPNSIDSDDYLASGEVLEVPSPSSDYRIELSEPLGLGFFLVTGRREPGFGQDDSWSYCSYVTLPK